jgi:hypothetical protein
MALFGKKKEEATDADGNVIVELAMYKVVYKGGHPDLPKAKSGEIRMVLTPDELRFNPTTGSSRFWQPLQIPYGNVRDVKIVARQVSTTESLLGGLDSRQLNQDNNIHVDHVDGEGRAQLLRFEMLSGITVMNQAKKCLELEDQLRTLGVRDQFQPAAAPPAPAAAAAAPAAGVDIPDQIAKLAALRDQGVLSADEFEAKKAELLDRL